ncbi:hypothetical protein J8F10_01875 [Gemmata sp. G18]|uniref:Uncharacterized protein n=1 Tax=Gemmata palustris TaxID=2822762 RepID=A0ABS5BK14_9BACT|nr:hypothetical protein [Gemmata palustris]MBP3954046.1 hypothetical protein [Gemmata palustris]
MEEEKKAKKPRAPKAPPPPKSIDELVQNALKLAATDPKAKWSAAKAGALFNTKEVNSAAAIERCLDANRPLLKQHKDGATLTGAGFEEVAATLSEEQVAPLAKSVAGGLPISEQADFLQGVIGRTPLAAAELNPLLEEAIAAEQASRQAREEEAAKRRAAEEASLKALERAQKLIAERQQARVAELLRLLEIEGQKPPEPAPRPTSVEPAPQPKSVSTVPETAEDKDFRRDVAAQLASSWRATWEMNKPDAREFLESAMWNISGFKLVGEVGQRVAYSGRTHESVAGVFGGDQVKVVRPGWALDEDAGEFVVLKAVVEK